MHKIFKKFVNMALMCAVFIFPAATAFGQEDGGVSAQEAAMGETDWVWGEVALVDNQNNQIAVKYLDYETTEEKDITFVVDSKTAYDGVGALVEIKPLDNVSVDFVITKEGINLARKVAVEKATAGDTAPVDNEKTKTDILTTE